MKELQPWEVLKLADASVDSGKTINSFIRMGASGHLPLWFWLENFKLKDNPLPAPKIGLVPPEVLALLLVPPGDKKGACTPYLLARDGSRLELPLCQPQRPRIISHGVSFDPGWKETVNGSVKIGIDPKPKPAVPQYFIIRPDKLYLLTDDLARIMGKTKTMPDEVPREISEEKDTPKKGGCPPFPFHDAVCKLYWHLYEIDKNHALIRRGERVLFAEELVKLADDNSKVIKTNTVITKYLAERIEPGLVTKNGVKYIRTKENADYNGKPFPPRNYTLKALSNTISYCRNNPPSFP
ncbi:MAG TPA: hypothetical protein DEQ20_00610 [Desulfobulbaceae bacterium]|nr:MAG: hypothetical protein A2520_00085 [Deltaproteobacteria bacterium RIFOXYD12_FULL_53_23]HCC53420.1 hypothetical protein [Desulfobulbaceae bacterium]